MMTVNRIIPRDYSILLSQGFHEPEQLVSNKPKKVPEEALICFSQPPCFII